MTLTELKQFLNKAKHHNPYCAEEYNTAIDAVEELEAYRASMLTPDKVEEMKGRIFELSVENDRLRFMKGERDG